jgi:hypothetical protein
MTTIAKYSVAYGTLDNFEKRDCESLAEPVPGWSPTGNWDMPLRLLDDLGLYRFSQTVVNKVRHKTEGSSPKSGTMVHKTVVSGCAPRTAAWEPGALRLLKPLENWPISSLLETQPFNPKGHLPICTGVTIEARRASDAYPNSRASL